MDYDKHLKKATQYNGWNFEYTVVTEILCSIIKNAKLSHFKVSF